MIVHALCGLACGFVNILFRWPPGRVFGVTAALLVAWEIGEVAFRVHEALENRVIDVMVGLAGTVVALAILPRVGRPVGIGLFWGTSVVFLAGDVLGWRAYRRRGRAARHGTRQPTRSPPV